jgi:multiple sugar transport system permease protein
VDLARDRGFREAVGNTLWWVLGSVAGRLVFALFLAVLLRRKMPLVRAFRAIALLPWVMPVAVAGVIWRWMFNGDWGVLNHMLRRVGLMDRNIIWMSAPGFRWFYIFSLSIWKEYPLYYIVLLARLQMIPEELYQAARIDGAGSWACLRYVTLPLLRATLYVLVLLGTVWTTTDFASMWMLTGRTATMATLAYGLAFRSWHLGYGSTVGVYMVLMLMVFATLYVRSVRGQVSD